MNNSFDSVARDWDKNDMHARRTNAIAALIKENFRPEQKLSALEFGAGTGLLSIALNRYFDEILLMDTSREMLKVTDEKLASSNIRHLHTMCHDLEKEEFQQKSFDYIFTQMALHHVGDINVVLKRFYQMLNVTGKLAIADLFPEDGSFHGAGFDGYLGFDPENLCKLLQEMGFSNIKYQSCFVISKSNSNGGTNDYPVFLLEAEK